MYTTKIGGNFLGSLQDGRIDFNKNFIEIVTKTLMGCKLVVEIDWSFFNNSCDNCIYAGHCWRSRDELIRDVLLWIPTHGRTKAGRPARTYIQQLCEDTGCCPEDLPRAMNDREEWRERVRDIRATSAIWWWWWNTQTRRRTLSNNTFTYSNMHSGCPRGVMVKAMDCGIVVSEFVFQSRYYVHFRANTLGNGMNPLILPAMG